MRNLVIAAAFISTVSLTVPGIAQEAGVGVGVGVGASAGAGSDGGVGVGASAEGGASAGAFGSGTAEAGIDSSTGTSVNVGIDSGGASVSGQALGAVDSQAIAGSSVVGSDGAEIGTVADIATDANGQVMITVNLAHDLDASIDTIRFRAEHATFVDQRVHLGLTRASFVSALETHLGAQASGG